MSVRDGNWGLYLWSVFSVSGGTGDYIGVVDLVTDHIPIINILNDLLT